MTRIISFATLALIASVALAEQPDGVSDTLYDCTYNTSDA